MDIFKIRCTFIQLTNLLLVEFVVPATISTFQMYSEVSVDTENFNVTLCRRDLVLHFRSVRIIHCRTRLQKT